MVKLPVFQTLGRALWFQIANLFTLFRLTWLPLALLIAAEIGVAWLLVQGIADKSFASPEGIRAVFSLSLTDALLQTIAFAVIAVQIHRVILFNARRPNEYFLYPFGWTEFRYILMGVISSVLIFVPLSLAAFAYYMARMKVSAVMVFMALAPAAVKTSPNDMLFSLVAIVVGVILTVWLALRLTVWPPSVVATNRLWPGEPWRLTRGNVLRLLGLWILGVLFLWVLIIGIQIGFLASFPDMMTTVHISKTPTVKEGVFNNFVILDPNWLLLEFISQFISTTYVVSMVSFAYKSLKGYNPDAPIGEQQQERAPDATPSSRTTPLHF